MPRDVLMPLGFIFVLYGMYLIGWVGGVVFARTGNRYYLSAFGLISLGIGTTLIGLSAI